MKDNSQLQHEKGPKKSLEFKSHPIFQNLSEEAKKIVYAPNDGRNIRIVAGAGAGKTEVLALRIIYLLLAGIALPKQIVAFTFTDKAAQSLQSRIYQRIQQFNHLQLTNQLCEMYIGTIHGYCKRLLKDFFGKFNLEILDDIKEKVFIHEMSEELGLNQPVEAIERKFHVILENIQKDREINSKSNHFQIYKKFSETYDIMNNEEITPTELYHSEFQAILKVITKYEKLLQENQLITFGQLIRNAVHELEQNPSPIKDLRFLFVDEYQDVNQAQEYLIKLLGQKHAGIKETSEIFVVGDPKQSIYNWRGSDLCCFKNFERLIPQKSINSLKIKTNYRSMNEIVNFTSDFARKAGINDFNLTQKTPKNTAAGMMVGMHFTTADEEAKNIIAQVRHMIEKKANLSYSDVAILCRSVSTTAEPFIRECKKQNVPFIIGGKIGLLRHDEITAITCFLMWLHEDGYWADHHTVTRNELLELGIKNWFSACEESNFKHPQYPRKIHLEQRLKQWKNDTLALLKKSLVVEDINAQLATSGIENIAAELDTTAQREAQTSDLSTPHHNILEKYNDFLTGETYYDIFNDLLYILGIRDFVLNDPFHTTMLANFGRFSQILNDFEFIRKNNGKPLNLYDSLPQLNEFLFHFQNVLSEQEEQETKYSHAIHIYTINQAKGLEWPVVFIPSVVKYRFPSSHVGKDPVNFFTIQDSAKIPFDMERYKTKLKDEARLFYVAVTRAKNIAIISRYQDPAKERRNRSDLLTFFPKNIQSVQIQDKIADHPQFPNLCPMEETNTNDEMDEYSITEILDYAKCPTFYQYRHHLKFSSHMNRLLGYGHALHHILQKIVADDTLDLNNGRQLKEKLGKLMDSDFRLPYLDEEVNKSLRKGAFRLLLGFLARYANELNTMTSVETRLELVEKNAIIKGIADVVLGNETWDGTKSRVWDYKTKNLGFEKINELQILLYCAALDDMGYNIDSGTIAYLKEQDHIPIAITQAALKQARIQVSAIVDKIRNKDFSSSINSGECIKAGCDHYKICGLSNYGKN